jgi:hypothetical protein
MLNLNGNEIRTLLLGLDVLRVTRKLPDPKAAGTIDLYDREAVMKLRDELLDALDSPDR